MPNWPDFYQCRPVCGGAAVEADLLAEPRLADLLDDPVLQALMRCDGVTRRQLMALAREFRSGQRRARVGPAAERKRPRPAIADQELAAAGD